MVNNAEKKIYFYKLNMKNGSQVVDPQTVFSHINSLPFSDGFDDNERYLKLYDGNVRSMFIDEISPQIRFQIGTKRTNGLPSLETKGETSPLKIPADSGLFESAHCMIFPNNVVGFESNFYGPRPNALKDYISNKAQILVDKVELIPLVRTDIYELLSRIGDIRLFRLRLHRDMDVSELGDNLKDAFGALKHVSDAEYLEVSVKTRSYSNDQINISFLDKLKLWLSRADAKHGIDDCTIRAKDTITNKVDTFDLLQQYILATKYVVKQDDIHRSVDSVAMYRAINEAYIEMRGEINRIVDGMN